jgi:molybdopterin molybdotransferase
VIGFDEAAALTASLARPLGREDVPLADAHRRVLAAPVVAQVSAPPSDASAMDGYAVREADLAMLPARLRLAGESFAGGGFAHMLAPGECVRIFTGAPIPAGADRVVVQEEVRREGDAAIFQSPLGPVRHVRKAGSDFRQGDLLLDAGVPLGPRQLVAAAAADLNSVTAWRRPRLIVLSTGDELVAPGTARDRPGSIPESLALGVAALAEEWGARFIGRMVLEDRLDEMEHAAEAALRDADLVVVTGGASVGARDFAKQMFAGQALDLVFSKVSIKPGKPVWLGRRGERLVLGLPGNPTSAMVTARLFLAPLLAGLTGRDPAAALRWRKLPLADSIGAVGDRETFARGVTAAEGVRILSNQDSNAQRTLAECELLVRLPPGSATTPAGQPVDVLDF